VAARALPCFANCLRSGLLAETIASSDMAKNAFNTSRKKMMMISVTEWEPIAIDR
jgi:hypothetical protein